MGSTIGNAFAGRTGFPGGAGAAVQGRPAAITPAAAFVIAQGGTGFGNAGCLADARAASLARAAGHGRAPFQTAAG